MILADRKLPMYNTEAELALSMNISVKQLRWLAFKPLTYPLIHYSRFQIAKKTGETRTIYAPKPYLKTAQTYILKKILSNLTVHDAAHGFCRDRSIITNAQPHIGADVIIKLDIEDFFSSITYKHVQKLFLSLGYSPTIVTLLGLICTIKDVETLQKRCLPSGSPASPTISNLVCYSLDQNVSQIASDLGFTYTRYADDLTFSGKRDRANISILIKQLSAVITQFGFKINPNKIQILPKSVRQQVTGIVVNHKLNISQTKLKAFRATLHQIEQDGLSGKKWGNSPNLMASITGFANYVAMINPEKGGEFLKSVEKIRQKHILKSSVL